MEVKWIPSMSVNEKTIDNQHKKLLAQIEKIIQIISSLEVNMSVLRETIRFLYEYIKDHLSYEEGYMRKNNYPDIEKHKEIHRNFVQFYENFQKELKEKITSGYFSSIEIKELLEKVKEHLADWWINHISTIDQTYAKYIKS